MTQAITLLLVGTLFVELVLLIRQTQVRGFMHELVHKVSNACQDDIVKGYAWEWRWKAFEGANPVAMTFRFWRPLTVKAWFPNDQFVQPDVKVSGYTTQKAIAGGNTVVS